MKPLDTPLIKDRAKRQLSALGYKQLNRIISKAAEQHKTSRFAKDFKPMRAQIELLVHSLIFDHNITKEQLSSIQRVIKVNDTTLQLPFFAS